MNRQSFLLAAALAGLAAGLSLPAAAADEFPQRPITRRRQPGARRIGALHQPQGLAWRSG